MDEPHPDDPVAQEFRDIADAEARRDHDLALRDYAVGLGKLYALLAASGFTLEQAFVLTRDFAQSVMSQHAMTAFLLGREPDDD